MIGMCIVAFLRRKTTASRIGEVALYFLWIYTWITQVVEPLEVQK